MKGHQEILDKLNKLLSEELAAISQYMVHSEMCEDWGFDGLHEEIESRAIHEMKHAESLIGRILFLEGDPKVSNLGEINVGKDIEQQIEYDLAAEMLAVKLYNEGIRLAVKLDDNGTRELLESILVDEEDHVDWLEAQQDLIDQMGLSEYLGGVKD